MSEVPRVEEISDNIQEPVVDNAADATTQKVQDPGFFNISYVIEATSKHYGKTFENLKMLSPPQIVDGAVVEFADSNNTVVAVARMRLRNKMIIHQEEGVLLVVAHMSDLTFNRSEISITASPAAESTEAVPTN